MKLDEMSQMLKKVGKRLEIASTQYQDIVKWLCMEACITEEDAERYVISLCIPDKDTYSLLKAIKEIIDPLGYCTEDVPPTIVLERHQGIGFWNDPLLMGHKAIVGNDGYGSGFK